MLYFYYTDPAKGKYKDSGVCHTLDMWHGSKNLGKKIQAVSVFIEIKTSQLSDTCFSKVMYLCIYLGRTTKGLFHSFAVEQRYLQSFLVLLQDG